MSSPPPLPPLAHIVEVSLIGLLAAALGCLLWERARTRRAAALRRQAEERLSLAMESAELGFWEWKPHLDSLWMDSRALSLHGFGADEVRINRARLLDQLAPEDRTTFANAYKALSGNAPDFSVDYHVTKPGGDLRHLMTRGRARFDAKGTLIDFTGITLDITARDASVELQQRREELAHATRAVTLSQLSGSLAHELNQPLAAISANGFSGVKLLEASDPDRAELRAILEDISADAARAGKIIHRLRSMLRKTAPDWEPVDVAALVEDTARLLHSDLVLRRVVLRHREIPPGLHVHGDRVQLQQVLVNLLLNAAEAMGAQPAHSRLVQLRAGIGSDRRVWIRVEDRGPGLPPERLVAPFEPFKSTKPLGLGLGLSICQAIMDTHQGTIRLAANAPERGLTATLVFPPAPP
jgi:signal transduction histidine kinase